MKGESQPSSGRPLVTSYDSGYEHSLEHWLDVQQLVEVDDAEPIQGSAGAEVAGAPPISTVVRTSA